METNSLNFLFQIRTYLAKAYSILTHKTKRINKEFMYELSNKVQLLNDGDLSRTEFEIKNILSVINEIINKGESALNEAVIRLKERIKGDPNLYNYKDDPEVHASYYSATYEDDSIFINEIHRQQRYSQLLILFTFYEDSLRKISSIVELKLHRKIGKKEKGVNDLEFYWNFLRDTLSFDQASLQDSFDYINSQKFIRNKIAHKNGVYKRTEIVTGKHEFKPQDGLSQIESGDDYKIIINSASYLINLMKQIELNLISLIYETDKII